jgi:tRNA acetyltransferase TAN1
VPPIEPASFVLSFCEDVASNPGRKRAHAVKRLTPMTLIGKATENGIEELAEKVLAPHFHTEGVKIRKVCREQSPRSCFGSA